MEHFPATKKDELESWVGRGCALKPQCEGKQIRLRRMNIAWFPYMRNTKYN